MFSPPPPGSGPCGRSARSSSPGMERRRWKRPRTACRACAACASSRSSAPGTPCSRPCRCCGDAGTTLILNGDVPLIEAATARALAAACGGTPAGAADDRAVRRHRLRPHRAQRQARSACDRRTQGRERRAARDPRGLHRHAGRADRVAEARGDGARKQQRAEGVLPDRHRGDGGGRGHGGGGHAGQERDRSARRQQPAATGRLGAALPAPRRPKR